MGWIKLPLFHSARLPVTFVRVLFAWWTSRRANFRAHIRGLCRVTMPYLAMKTKALQLGAIAMMALTSAAVAADQSPAPSSPPSSSPTDIRNPTNPSSPAAQDSASPGSSTTAEAMQLRGKVTAIDKDTRVVTVQDSSGNTKKLHIGETTKLMKGGSNSAKFEDLQVGTEIRAMHKSQGATPHAESVTISTEAAR